MVATEILRKTDAGFKPASRLDDGPLWYADVRRRSRTAKISEIVILSPSRAQALLDANPDNRKISDATVATYATDIAEDRWVFNGESIIVADTGELNDGQHRCEAVIMANKAIEVLLVAGVPRAARTTTDMGRARTVGDFVHMHNIPDANHVAAVAAIVLAFENGDVRGYVNADHYTHVRRTKAEILSFARANIADINRALHGFPAAKAGPFGGKSRLAGMFAVIGRKSRDWQAVEEFFRALVDGDSLRRGSPILVARERLTAEKTARSLNPSKNFEILARAWNAHRNGLSMSRLTINGNIPEIAV